MPEPFYTNEKHRLSIYHGECVKVLQSLPEASVDLIVTSPPYNCRKDYGEHADEIPWMDYYAHAARWIRAAYRLLVDGGTLAINVPGVVRWQSDHKYADTWKDFDPSYHCRRDGELIKGKGRIEPIAARLTEIMRKCDPHLREPIVWVKGDSGINSKYQMGCDSDPFCRPAHELILLGSKRRWYHRGGTGRRGKDALPWLDECKDVWFIDAAQDPNHPAVFPREIPARLFRLFCHAPDSVVLDPFMGSGTTLSVAREFNLAAIGIERELDHCRRARNALRDTAFLPFMSEPHEPVKPKPDRQPERPSLLPFMAETD